MAAPTTAFLARLASAVIVKTEARTITINKAPRKREMRRAPNLLGFGRSVDGTVEMNTSHVVTASSSRAGELPLLRSFSRNGT
jgi:hypothetical protein